MKLLEMLTSPVKALIISFAAIGSAFAQTCTWTGEKGDGKWSSVENWENDAKPVSGNGDEVVISGVGLVNGEMENDIGQMTLAKLTFAGATPFRLTGAAIVPASASECLVKTATVCVTNATPIVLSTEGDYTFRNMAGSGDMKGANDFVITGVISGAGRVAVKGDSTRRVALAGENTHTGGLKDVDGSTLTFSNAKAAGAVGAVAEVNRYVWFNALGDYRCAITNTATGGYDFVFQKQGTYEFYGPVYAAATGQIKFNSYQYPKIISTSTIIFHERVDFPNATSLYPVLGNGFVTKFMAPVTVKSFAGGSSATDCASWIEFHSTGNNVESITPSYCGRFATKINNAFTQPPVLLYNAYTEASEAKLGIFDLCGTSQTLACIEGQANKGVIKSTGGAGTLTLLGSKSATAYAIFKDNVSLIYAAADPATVQTLSNKVHETTGNITVSSGTVRLAGAASMTTAGRIDVGASGAFELETTLDNALSGVKKISVADGGRFAVVNGATPFAETCSLKLGSSATFALPDGAAYTFANATVGGTALAAKTYSGDPESPDYLPQLSGKGTITLLSDSLTCTWTGGAGDGKWSSAANWEDGAQPEDGASVVVSGTGLDAGQMVNDIAGLTLRALDIIGTKPLRISGEGIAFASAANGLTCSVAADVTNAVAVVLPAGDNLVTKDGTGTFVLEGAFSGEGKLVMSATNGGKFLLAEANTQTGGTAVLTSDALTLAGPSVCPAGSLLEVNGSFTCATPGDYEFDIRETATSGTAICYLGGKDSIYNFNGRIWSDTLAGTLRVRNLINNPGSTLNFNGGMDCPLTTYDSALDEHWSIHFKAPVRFRSMSGNESYSSIGAASHLYDTNTVETISPCYSLYFRFHLADAFPTIPVVYYDRYMGEGTSSSSGLMNFHGYDQTFDRLAHRAAQAAGDYWTRRGVIRSTAENGGSTAVPARLTLKGTASAATSVSVMDAVTVVWDPADAGFVQTFENRESPTTGDLIVSNGTLAVSGTAAFPNVKRIVVAAGAKFLLDVSVPNALASVESIEVAAGGTCEIAAGATPFSAGRVVLDIATGSSFKLPAADTYDFAGIRKDGEALDADVYTHDNLDEISGGAISARDLPVERKDATWNGAADPDRSIGTDGNWVGSVAPKLTGGALVATFATPVDGVDIDRDVDWLGLVYSGTAGNFTFGGTGSLTVRGEGIAVAPSSTNTVSVPLTVRGNQTWDVGEKSRLVLDASVDSHFGSESVHKTGLGELWINAPVESMGPFTLGSRTESGGTVFVNVATNAFGPASDEHEVRICGVTGSDNKGSMRVATSTVIERPVTFDSENSYYVFVPEADATVRFTKAFNTTQAMRTQFGPRSHVICEGGGTLSGWACLGGGGGTASLTFTGKPFTADYLYLQGGGPNVTIDTVGNTVRGVDFVGGVKLTVTQPYGLDTEAMRVSFGASGAILDVTGDQRIGGLFATSGGTITSAEPATVFFKHENYSSTTLAAATNAAVNVSGAVTLYKYGSRPLTLDCAGDTTGGLGISNGVLRLTKNATFRKATRFLVEGEGRMELEAAQLLGRRSALRIASTATLRLDGDQKVRELYVDGVRQPDGKYAATSVGGATALSCLEGSGTLTVGGGILLIVR